MLKKRLLMSMSLALLASACETTEVAPLEHPSILAATREADAALKAGQHDKAMQLLQGSTKAFPAVKTAWLKLAQLHFDQNRYGEAIVHAQAVIERDPDDMVAHSIVAVSGLRLASKALADLSQKNRINGDLRSEAQSLAKLMRSSLNEDVLVPPAKTAQRPAKRAAPSSPAAVSSDPFATLK
jgi:tetratricopeptide (TPR) repeat protein